MKALVIGGNGFIGSHLVEDLVARNWQVTVLDLYERRYGEIPPSVKFLRGDVSHAFLLREALLQVDVVYHLAWSTIHEIANQEPAADVKANLIPTIHLLEACQRAAVSRVIFTSSGGTVYGPAQRLPIPETHQKRPITGYGITKLAVEKYLHMFRHLYGLEYAVLRPSVPYGPRQNPLAKQGAVGVFLYRVSRGLPVTLWGDGSTNRDYFYISDLVQALVAAAERDVGEDPVFNIGGAEKITLSYLLQRVEETVGSKAIVEYLPARDFDAPSILLDTSRAAEVLDWRSSIPLSQGLACTWDWMKEAFKDE